MSAGKVKSCIRAINYQLHSDSESDSDSSMKRKGLAQPLIESELREKQRVENRFTILQLLQ